MTIQNLIPAGLAFMMFSMGLGLRPAHFSQLIKQPNAAIAALVCQLLILPISAFAIASLLNLSTGLTLGLVLVACCPGGITSNMITRLALGDTALSIGLTAITSLITVLTIPAILQLTARLIGTEAQSFQVPFGITMAQIFALTIVPLSIGMALRYKFASFAQRAEPTAVFFAACIFALLVVLTWIDQRDNIVDAARVIGLAVVLVLAVNMTLGYATGRLLKLREEETTTLIVEVGIQNSAMAFLIAANILEDMTMAIPSALYSVLMIFAGLLVIGLRRRGVSKCISN